MILLMLVSALTFLVSGITVLFKGKGWAIMFASSVVFVALLVLEGLIVGWSFL